MFKRGKKTAIYLHDGTQWRVVVAAPVRGKWSLLDSQRVLGSALRLPEELLAFAEKRHARRMLVLLSAEVHSLSFEGMLDADPEELQTALRYEAAQSLGSENDALRLAATNAEFYNLGCEANTWLLASFPEDRLNYFERLALDRGLKFLGCGSLELALLGWFSRRHPGGEARLLLVKEADAFYVAPGLGEIPFVCASLPVGSRFDPDSERDRERLERASRRLAAHRQLPACLVTCLETVETAGTERLLELTGGSKEMPTQRLDDLLEELVACVCDDIGKYAGSICPLIGPTPPHRDPYRVGTWLFFAIVLLTAAGILTNWHSLVKEEAALQARKQAWSTLESARKNAKDKGILLRKQRDTEIQRRNALLNTPVFPKGLPETIETIATAMPPYTKLESIASNADGSGFEIRGRTHWQAGLADFFQTLNDALRPSGMTALQDSVAMADGGQRELSFICRIIPMEARP